MTRPARVPRLAILLLIALCAACSSGSPSSAPASAVATATPSTSSPTPSVVPSIAVSTAPSLVPTSLLAGAKGWLAYQACTGCSSDLDDRIHLTHVDGSEDHVIPDGLTGRRAHPDFSRDGTMLAFDRLADEDGADQTYVANAEGSEPRLVGACDPPDCLDTWEPAWSPDGRTLAVVTAGGPLGADGPATFGLAILDVASGKATPILVHPASNGQDHFPRWSKDASKLVFWRERPASNGSPESAIFVIDAKGGEPRQLTDWSLMASDPDWSPDGSAIVFTTYPLVDFPTTGQSNLSTMAPDGSNKRAITAFGPSGPRATQPRWSPDGLAILYTRTTQTGSPRTIWAIGADGANELPVIGHLATHPILQPTP